MTKEVTMIVKFTITADKAVMSDVITKLKETTLVSFTEHKEVDNIKTEFIFQDDYKAVDPDQLELFTN
jgi:NADPH-dependent 7-cyano-7-deazaguanine reductase QueF